MYTLVYSRWDTIKSLALQDLHPHSANCRLKTLGKKEIILNAYKPFSLSRTEQQFLHIIDLVLGIISNLEMT